jgi:small subunit ribosomal protein S7
MAKKFESTERFLKPDVKYGSRLIAKFINCLMRDGKKSVAERIFYGAADVVEERSPGTDFVEFFQTAINNIKPPVEVRSRRVGGANYQVPVQVTPKRQQALAFRWILEGVRARGGRPTSERLGQELIDAHNRTGHAWSQRENTLRMADASKAFAHFAW